MRLIFASAVLACAPLCLAAQPYSTSMAQCGGIYSAMLAYIETPDRREVLTNIIEQWRVAGTAQAQAEGVKKPGVTIDATLENTRQEWEAKGPLVVFSQDMKDWMSYCRNFAKDRGIDMSAISGS